MADTIRKARRQNKARESQKDPAHLKCVPEMDPNLWQYSKNEIKMRRAANSMGCPWSSHLLIFGVIFLKRSPASVNYYTMKIEIMHLPL